MNCNNHCSWQRRRTAYDLDCLCPIKLTNKNYEVCEECLQPCFSTLTAPNEYLCTRCYFRQEILSKIISHLYHNAQSSTSEHEPRREVFTGSRVITITLSAGAIS
jgi:hypothetical protein